VCLANFTCLTLRVECILRLCRQNCCICKWNEMIDRSIMQAPVDIVIAVIMIVLYVVMFFTVLRSLQCYVLYGVTFFTVLRSLRCYVPYGITFFTVSRSLRCHVLYGVMFFTVLRFYGVTFFTVLRSLRCYVWCYSISGCIIMDVRVWCWPCYLYQFDVS